MTFAEIIASLTWDYWFMFVIAFCIAATAMASGIEGAAFFAPIFILFLGLPADIAIGTGLITEVFGFTSGLVSYTYRKQIDFKLGRAILIATVPMAVIGTVLSFISPALLLKGILGLLLLALALTNHRYEIWIRRFQSIEIDIVQEIRHCCRGARFVSEKPSRLLFDNQKQLLRQ